MNKIFTNTKITSLFLTSLILVSCTQTNCMNFKNLKPFSIQLLFGMSLVSVGTAGYFATKNKSIYKNKLKERLLKYFNSPLSNRNQEVLNVAFSS